MTASLVERRSVILAIVDAGVWAAWSALCGYFAHRLPASRLAHDRGLFRLGDRPDQLARRYERVLRIQRWKRWLPEAGDLFAGGFSKKRMRPRERAYFEQFVVETRRAELTHWLIAAIGPLFFLWNPWWLATVMLAYAVAANVPCLLVQRYNRVRLLRVLRRMPS